MKRSTLEPYLIFGGRCEEALALYGKVLGAQVDMLVRFKESPQPNPSLPAGYENKVMHTTFHIGENVLMASDGDEVGAKFEGFSLSLALPTEEEVNRAFNGLAEGGQVTLPLGKTFWSPRFGMLKDKFGVAWMISIAS